MSQKVSPFVGINYGWNLGEGGWNSGMDDNLLKLSYFTESTLDGIVSSLPVAVNGTAYFLTTDNKVYYAVDGTYYFSSVPKWKKLYDKSTGNTYQYDGSTLVTVDSPSQINSRLSNLETLSTGFTNFQSNLANQSDPTKGATLVGYKGRTLYNKLLDSVSVKDFGAVGNGVTDDTSAIQAAIDYFYGGVGTVIIPPGNYVISSTLNITKPYMTIKGAGRGATTITRDGSFTDTFLIKAPTAIPIPQVTISDININCTAFPTAGSQIKAVVANGLKLEKISMGSVFIGVSLQGCFQVSISDVYMTNAAGTSAPTGRIGLVIEKAPAAYTGVLHGANISVDNLQVYSGYTIGTNLPGWDKAVEVTSVDGVWFSNCYFGSSNSINFSTTNADATAGLYNVGIMITNSWFDFGKGSAFNTVGTSGSNYGNYLISNCVFFGGNDNVSGVGIAGNLVGFTFTGNRLTNYKNSGLALNSANISNIEIVGNTFKDINTSGGGSGHGVWIINGTNINVSSNSFITGTSCNGIQVVAGSKITINGNNITSFVNGINIVSGPTQYVVTSNNTAGVTGTGVNDGGGAVSKVVANNL